MICNDLDLVIGITLESTRLKEWCSLEPYKGEGALTYCVSSGVMSQNIWGGTIFARERSDRAGGGCGRGCPPSHGRELFHFST